MRISKAVYDQKCTDDMITNAERDDFLVPGPFSFATYLRALLDPEFWGDEMCLVGISIMWQVGITVLDIETLHTIRVCHNNVLHKADIVAPLHSHR